VNTQPAPPTDRRALKRWRRVAHWCNRAADALQRLGATDAELRELDRLAEQLRQRLVEQP
jgi:hypothetical protein